MRSLRWLLFMVFILSLGGANIFAAESKPIYGGTLRFAPGAEAVGLDPAHETDGESFKVTENLFDTLTRFKLGTTELEPSLAERWEISSDGKTYTFFLRGGVKFHDGTDLNADAVLFSFLRQHDPKHPFAGIGGPYTYWQSVGLKQLVAKIEKIGDLTVKIELTRPESPFLSILAMPFLAIVSPSALEKHRENFANHPVGSGPFVFKEWVRGNKIVLEANSNYWEGRPYLDRVIFRMIPDNTTRFLEMLTEGIDMMDFPNPEDLPGLKGKPNVNLLTQQGLNIGYLAMNMEKEPFKDVRVRKAINYAVNKKEIVKAFFGDLGISAKNPIPPILWGYNDTIEDYPYDPEQAKTLLAEAGLAQGFKTTLWAMPVARPYMPDARKVATAIQADLRKIGIQAEIVSFDWGTYLDKTNNGEHDMALLGWTGDTGDPDNFFSLLLDKTAAEKPASNIAFYRSEVMHALISEAKITSDQNVRESLYKRACLVFHEDAPWVPLVHANIVIPTHKKVQGYAIDPVDSRRFMRTWIAKP